MIEKINYLKNKDKYILQLTKCCPIIFKHFAILVDPRYSARTQIRVSLGRHSRYIDRSKDLPSIWIFN